MADKYQVASIRTHLVRHINDNWPQTFQQWVDLDIKDIDHRRCYYIGENDEMIPVGRILPEPAANLRFAIEYGKNDMLRSLPAIIYDLSRCKFTENYDDMLEDDGSSCVINSARWYLLDRWGLMVVSTAKERLEKMLTMHERFGNVSTSSSCPKADEDEKTIRRLWDGIRLDVGIMGDILYQITQRIGSGHKNTLREDEGLCNGCAYEVHQRLLDVRRDVWIMVEKSINEYHAHFTT